MRSPRPLPLLLILTVPACALSADEPGPFAPSRLETTSGGRIEAGVFESASECGFCHVSQYEAWNRSLHSRAHTDSIYLAFAELAREEAGEEMYVFCSACHAPGAVVTGAIPGPAEKEEPFLKEEGVTCDVCHRVTEVRAAHREAGMNASVVLDEGETRYGPIEDPVDEATHESAYREVFTQSRFCSACHTLVHPHNGLVIENTYEEWKQGPFAQTDVNCQDCHMRTVGQALAVAATRRPLPVAGAAYDGGSERENVHAHWFVGANSNAGLTGGGETHAEMARERLKTAVRMRLALPEAPAVPGESVSLGVEIENVAAGHAIPTSITELRQVWIDLQVLDATGAEIFRSGAVGEDGAVDPGAVMYHSVLVDEGGEVTYLPWRAARMVKEKLIPPGETVRERFAFTPAAGTPCPLRVRARLRYRSAPQEVLDELFGKGRFALEIVDMAEAEETLRVEALSPDPPPVAERPRRSDG